MKTAITLTALIMALPFAGMAQPDDLQAGRDEAPPRQGWRGGDGQEFRGLAGPRDPAFRGEFGPGPRARQGAPGELRRGPGPRRCPNCGWCPQDGAPRGQGLGLQQRRQGAGGPPAWGPEGDARPERPGLGPRAGQDDDGPPYRRGGPWREQAESDEVD